jgi:hypothetical protein
MIFAEGGSRYVGPIVQIQDLTVFNVIRKAVVVRQVKPFDQLPPTPGVQNVAFQPAPAAPPAWWADAPVPLD